MLRQSAYLLRSLTEGSAQGDRLGGRKPRLEKESNAELFCRGVRNSCAGCFVYGQQPQGGTSQPTKSTAQADLTNLLDAKIKAEWEAIKNKDQKAYGELLTDDFIGVEADREGERYKWKAQMELQESAVHRLHAFVFESHAALF